MFAVWEDFEAAPVDDRIKAALRLIVRFTDHPDDLGASDFATLRELGVSDRAIEDVLHVATLFHIVPRIADALEFHVPDWATFMRRGKAILRRGYGG